MGETVSLPFLKGSEIALVGDLRNPNAASSCGCGVSFSIQVSSADGDIDPRPAAPQPGLMWKLSLAALAAVAVSGCSSGCENTTLTRSGSPDGRLSAVLFERSCGATTDSSTQISVLRRGVPPSTSGNAFVANTNHGAADAGIGGGPWAEAVWTDDRNLVVRYDARSRVFSQPSQVSGVKVTYQPIER